MLSARMGWPYLAPVVVSIMLSLLSVIDMLGTHAARAATRAFGGVLHAEPELIGELVAAPARKIGQDRPMQRREKDHAPFA
jgi:hypothetical protein